MRKHDFTNEQQREIMEYYQNVQKKLQQNEINPQNLAEIIQGYFPETDFQKVFADCQAMEAGIKRFEIICKKVQKEEIVQSKEVLERITEDKNEQQKKGFSLIVYDALRKADAVTYQEAALAKEGFALIQETEEVEFQKLVFEQVNLQAEKLVTETINEEKQEVTAAEEEIPSSMILGTALYCTSLNGSIVSEFAEHTEITGVCSAACTNLVEKIKENPKQAENPSWTANIIKGIYMIALPTVIMTIVEPQMITREMILHPKTISTGNILKKCLNPVIQTAKTWVAKPLRKVGKTVSNIFTSAKQKMGQFYEKVKSKAKSQNERKESEKKKQRKREQIGIKKQYQ